MRSTLPQPVSSSNASAPPIIQRSFRKDDDIDMDGNLDNTLRFRSST